MGIVNRRNAVLGWVVWQVGKRGARRKARGAVSTGTARSKKGVAALIAALSGAIFFWRRRRSSDEPE